MFRNIMKVTDFIFGYPGGWWLIFIGMLLDLFHFHVGTHILVIGMAFLISNCIRILNDIDKLLKKYDIKEVEMIAVKNKEEKDASKE